uniref:Uncharacterized protein n=1 Tax=mine drainage metagenome TaxID=410659 RepID=E6PUK7_9ZZZZ
MRTVAINGLMRLGALGFFDGAT